MTVLLTANRVAIVVFALASGLYKVAGGAADVELFARVGLSATGVAIFGLLQAVAGLMLIRRGWRVPGAIALTVCNAFATYGLFVGGVQPFGYISIVFIAMAIAAAW